MKIHLIVYVCNISFKILLHFDLQHKNYHFFNEESKFVKHSQASTFNWGTFPIGTYHVVCVHMAF